MYFMYLPLELFAMPGNFWTHIESKCQCLLGLLTLGDSDWEELVVMAKLELESAD